MRVWLSEMSGEISSQNIYARILRLILVRNMGTKILDSES
jgi:hypothetical protein